MLNNIINILFFICFGDRDSLCRGRACLYLIDSPLSVRDMFPVRITIKAVLTGADIKYRMICRVWFTRTRMRAMKCFFVNKKTAPYY